MGTQPWIQAASRQGLVTLAATATGLLILSGCSGSSTLDNGKLQDEITREVQAVVPEGTAVSVTCPSDVAVQSGATTECTMTVAEQPATVIVTQEDDQGNVVFESTSAILFLDRAQEEITNEVAAQVPGSWSTACNPAGANAGIYLATPGTTFDCTVSGTASSGEQQSGIAVVTVDDNKGNISFVVQ